MLLLLSKVYLIYFRKFSSQYKKILVPRSTTKVKNIYKFFIYIYNSSIETKIFDNDLISSSTSVICVFFLPLSLLSLLFLKFFVFINIYILLCNNNINEILLNLPLLNKRGLYFHSLFYYWISELNNNCNNNNNNKNKK